MAVRVHDRQSATMTKNFRNVGRKETSLVINQSSRNVNSDANNKRARHGKKGLEAAQICVRNCPAMFDISAVIVA